mgnify:CR=1 FL=1
MRTALVRDKRGLSSRRTHNKCGSFVKSLLCYARLPPLRRWPPPFAPTPRAFRRLLLCCCPLPVDDDGALPRADADAAGAAGAAPPPRPRPPRRPAGRPAPAPTLGTAGCWAKLVCAALPAPCALLVAVGAAPCRPRCVAKPFPRFLLLLWRPLPLWEGWPVLPLITGAGR